MEIQIVITEGWHVTCYYVFIEYSENRHVLQGLLLMMKVQCLRTLKYMNSRYLNCTPQINSVEMEKHLLHVIHLSVSQPRENCTPENDCLDTMLKVTLL